MELWTHMRQEVETTTPHKTEVFEVLPPQETGRKLPNSSRRQGRFSMFSGSWVRQKLSPEELKLSACIASGFRLQVYHKLGCLGTFKLRNKHFKKVPG